MTNNFSVNDCTKALIESNRTAQVDPN